MCYVNEYQIQRAANNATDKNQIYYKSMLACLLLQASKRVHHKHADSAVDINFESRPV